LVITDWDMPRQERPDQQSNKLQRLVSRREPIIRRLGRKAERHPGQDEQQHQPAERPWPAPTTRVQNAAFPQLHRGIPQREGLVAGECRPGR
jgi:hypothetical protein